VSANEWFMGTKSKIIQTVRMPGTLTVVWGPLRRRMKRIKWDKGRAKVGPNVGGEREKLTGKGDERRHFYVLEAKKRRNKVGEAGETYSAAHSKLPRAKLKPKVRIEVTEATRKRSLSRNQQGHADQGWESYATLKEIVSC